MFNSIFSPFIENPSGLTFFNGGTYVDISWNLPVNNLSLHMCIGQQAPSIINQSFVYNAAIGATSIHITTEVGILPFTYYVCFSLSNIIIDPNPGRGHYIIYPYPRSAIITAGSS